MIEQSDLPARSGGSRQWNTTPVLALIFLTLLAGGPTASARIIYVDAHGGALEPTGLDWVRAYQTLQQALDVATDGDEIWVTRAGKHKPSLRTDPGDPRSATFLIPRAVKIYGGFAGTEEAVTERDLTNGQFSFSTLSGDIGTESVDTDNAYHVVTAIDTSTAVLDGFVIERGMANGPGAHGNGGGLYIERSPLQLANCLFYVHEASRGGALWVAASRPVIRDCVFSFSDAQVGGAVYIERSEPTFTHCSFTDSTADHGGGLYADSCPSLTLDSCTFSSNSLRIPTGQGGALFIVGDPDHESSLEINRPRMHYNSGHEGGAMFIGDHVYPAIITWALITNNQSTGDGGGIRNISHGCLIENSTIAFNDAEGSGGGLSMDGGNPFLSNCHLYDNSAGVGGGALAVSNADALFCDGGLYADNHSSGDGGGAIRLEAVDTVQIQYGLFRANYVDDDNWPGGAIWIIDDDGTTDAKLFGVRFIDNHGWYGGAMLSRANSLLVHDCDFERNIAAPKDGTGFGGGAIFASGQSLTVRKSDFLANQALRGPGGGIHAVNRQIRVEESSFQQNIAKDGGALSDTQANPIIDESYYQQCFFLGNQATHRGGAVYLSGAANFDRSYFHDNQASSDGSALFCSQSQAALWNCLVANNHGSASGTISCEPGTSPAGVTDPLLVILNSTITANTAHPAVWVADGGLQVHNSIVYGNAVDPLLPGQIQINQSVTRSFSHSILGGLWPGTGILNIDPLFANSTDPLGPDNKWGTDDDGFMLRFNSPAINVGDNKRALPGSDIRGKDRIRELTVDLGAYEMAFKDRDLDGFSDLAEKLASTRLDDSGSHPAFAPLIDLARRTLTFFPKTGETYQIERSIDLENWQPFDDPVSWEDSIVILPLFAETPTLPREFFRVTRLSP